MRIKQISLVLICVFVAPWCRGDTSQPDPTLCKDAKKIVVDASVALIRNATNCKLYAGTLGEPLLEVKCLAEGKIIRDIWIDPLDATNTSPDPIKELALSAKAFYGTLSLKTERLHVGFNTDCQQLWRFAPGYKTKNAGTSVIEAGAQ